MIRKLTGLVEEIDAAGVILNVAGVGYYAACPPRILAGLPPTGAVATLWIETQIRDDALQLFGFAAPGERIWFRALIRVQGVGVRLALAILGRFRADEITAAILTGDAAQLQTAPGVGKRIAERIVNELKDKIPESALALAPPAANGAQEQTAMLGAAVSALVNLGYAEASALKAARAALRRTENPALDAVIRDSLRHLAP